MGSHELEVFFPEMITSSSSFSSAALIHAGIGVLSHPLPPVHCFASDPFAPAILKAVRIVTKQSFAQSVPTFWFV